MAEGSNDEDKTEEPSARKLSQAREKGDVAKSADLAQALAIIGICGVLAFKGPDLCMDLVALLSPFMTPHQLLASVEGDGGLAIARHLVMAMLPILIIIFAGALLFGVGGHVMQTGLLFTGEKIKPKMDKLDLIKGMGRLFGVDALVNFGKTVLKLIVTGAVVWVVMKDRLQEVMALGWGSPVLILPYAREVLISLALAVCIFLLLAGGADFLWQRYRFMQKMKMSKQEVKDEYKSTEGDPHVRARLRQLRLEKSRRRMMQDVAKATVVVTNPTHYAVALKYDLNETPVPVCVAKGVDALALRIREEATKNGVPIVEDPPLARALFATMDIDETLPEAHFAAVAKLMGFVMAKKKRGF